MPIYEYQCSTCGHRLEEMQKFSDAPLTTCPECGKPTLERLVSHTSFQLKGGGYYATDYKTKPVEKPSSTGESKPAASDTSAKESAPASTPSSDKTEK